MLGFNYKKAVQALNYFAKKEGGSIDRMKAFKLIWLADRKHLRKYGRPILSDKYYAMVWGAVPSSTKDLAQKESLLDDLEKSYRDKYIRLQKKSYEFSSIKAIDEAVFSETDVEVMSDAYTYFGDNKGIKLSNICHDYPEWKKFEESLKRKEASRFEMDYLDFFEDPIGKNFDYFACDKEDLLLAKSIYQENLCICS
ncbi:MAG: Panacea domain-containing protein [Patescibacteria group bacterium]|nr:Panacea domain-containing protein [Patescibacteria group bacterium]